MTLSFPVWRAGGPWRVKDGGWAPDDGTDGLFWLKGLRCVREDGVEYRARRIGKPIGREAEAARLRRAMEKLHGADFQFLRERGPNVTF